MKYKLKEEIKAPYFDNLLYSRGVKDINKYLNPEEDVLLNEEDLDNIKTAYTCLDYHLENESKICIIVD